MSLPQVTLKERMRNFELLAPHGFSTLLVDANEIGRIRAGLELLDKCDEAEAVSWAAYRWQADQQIDSLHRLAWWTFGAVLAEAIHDIASRALLAVL